MVVKFSKGVHFDINNPNDLGWLVVLKKHSVEYVQLINEMEYHWDSTYLVNVKVFEELFRDMKISLLLYGGMVVNMKKTT